MSLDDELPATEGYIVINCNNKSTNAIFSNGSYRSSSITAGAELAGSGLLVLQTNYLDDVTGRVIC